MKERLIRIFIIILIALGVVVLVKSLVDWQGQSAGEATGLPQLSIKEKVENLGEQVLGKAVMFLPGAPDLAIEEHQEETAQEPEPIEKPVKDIEDLTEALIKALKALPQDQLEATKKQIRKEFCEGILSEE